MTNFSVEILTDPGNRGHRAVAGIAFCRADEEACYVPVGHTGDPNIPGGITAMKAMFENPSLSKTFHGLKKIITLLGENNISLHGSFDDIEIASYLLNPNRPDHGLDKIAIDLLGYAPSSTEEAVTSGSFIAFPAGKIAPFAVQRACMIRELSEILTEKLKSEGMEQIYREIEMPLVPVLADMEKIGIRTDSARIKLLADELEREIGSVRTRIFGLAGEEFNINSPRQISRILFETIGLKPLRKGKTGFSTSVDTLEELAKLHPLPGEILAYRSLFKLKSSYIDVLPRLMNPASGRIHASFNQTAAATGRLSCSEPNLQSIPVRGSWGHRIREVFIADRGCVLLSADYSQIELRILAHLSEDPVLCSAFRENADIHARTAAELFETTVESVTKDMRRVAKTVNFGVIYGMSPHGLSEALGIGRKDAESFIERYFERHAGVKAYTERALDQARELGYTATVLGRKRPLPDIKSSHAVIRQQAERMAINSPVQGTAADLIKMAMIAIHRLIQEKDLRTRMLLQIHDELLFEVHEEEKDEASRLIAETMESVMQLSVPLRADIGMGKNWAEAH